MQKGTRGQSFLYGALLLTGGMAAVKVLGALFKIPLQGIVGAYGMGLFHTAYHYLGPVFTLATAGFPVAVSRLVSEQAALGRWEQVRRARKTAMPLFLALGAGGVGLLGLAAPWYCRKVLGDPLAGAPVAALAPAVLLGTVGAVYRGYWEGLRNMAPTALSQILEAVVRLGAGLLGAWAAMAWGRWEWAARGTVLGGDPGPEGLPLARAALGAAGAMAGVTAGCGASALYLWAKSRRGDGLPLGAGRDTPSEPVGRKLLSILLPVGAGSLAGNAAGLLEASLLPRRLAAAWEASPQAILSLCGGSLPQEALSQPQALPTFLYGCCAMALTLSLLVPAVAQAFGASALPAVTQAWARGRGEELRHRMGAVLHGAALFSFPLGLGLAALGEPLAQALYGEGPGGRLAGAALSVLGAASLPTALCGPLSSMLQGVGRADLPPKFLALAMGVKLGAEWLLCALPQVHLLGLGLASFLAYGLLAAALLGALCRETGARLALWPLLGKPLLCALLCAGAAWGCFRGICGLVPWQGLGKALSLGASVGAGGCVYVLSLLFLRSVSKNELFMLPKGQKIAKMLEKRGWI